MQLIYEEQKLMANQLNNAFNEIDNCEIIRPSWKKDRTYGDTFFVKKRKGAREVTKNYPAGNVVDTITLDGVEFILIHNNDDIHVAYDDGVNYTDMGLTYTKTDNTPIRFARGHTGGGEFTSGFTMEDAFYDTHYRGVWNSSTQYVAQDLVDKGGTLYTANTANINKDPATETKTWEEYDLNYVGYNEEDPADIEYRNVFVGRYLKVKMSGTNVENLATAGKYIIFPDNDSNLQGVTVEIEHATQDYKDASGNDETLPSGEVFVYIAGTNYDATRPYVTEDVIICSEAIQTPVIATSDKVISLNLIKSGGDITGVDPIVVYEAEGGDEIVDLVNYNKAIFALTKDKIMFTRELNNSNVNFYPLDSYLNLEGLDRLIPFGKALIIFGTNNAVITPVVGTEGTEGYIYSELHYNGNLYSKYSAISARGTLYVLQDDKQFLKLDITSDNEVDYHALITNPIQNVRGLFDFVVGDIFMNEWDRNIYILDVHGSVTNYYKYDIEYSHWHIGQYIENIYKIEDLLYGTKILEQNDEYFDNTADYFDQTVGFDFGGDELTAMKTVVMVKLIFGLNEQILDYELEVEYQLGGILHNKIIDLKNYPINMDIAGAGGGLGDSQFGATLLGEGTPTVTTAIGNYVSVTVGLGITGTSFNFKIKSKENGFVYGGSTIGYLLSAPTVTEYNYKH